MRFILCKCIKAHDHRCDRRGILHYSAGLFYAVPDSDVRALIIAKVMEPIGILNQPEDDEDPELRALFDEVHAPPPSGPELDAIGPQELVIDAPIEGEPLAADDQ